MKKIYTLSLFLLSTIVGHAQLNQTIDFENWYSPTNNDKYNNFQDGGSLLQKSFDGINDGGCLEPTPWASSYPSVAKFRKLLQVSTTPTTASICFQYDDYDYSSSNDDGAILAFLNPDGTGGVSFKASGEKITIHTAAVNKTVSYAELTDGHWYQLTAKISINPSQPSHLLASIYLYDIGAAGTSTATLLQSNTDQDLDIALTGNTAQLTLDGCTRGGGAILDKFSIAGQAALGITGQHNATMITVPDHMGNTMELSCSLQSPVSYQLYAADGGLVRQGSFTGSTVIDCTSLPAAPYLLTLQSGNGSATRKLSKY
jgi:hypothetical protein